MTDDPSASTNPFDRFNETTDHSESAQLLDQLIKRAVQLDREKAEGAGALARLAFADACKASEDLIEAWGELAAAEREQLRSSTVALKVTREFVQGEAPARVWLIERWLPEGRAGLFTGEGGRGKSWLALQLAASLAAGEAKWLPGATNGPVILDPKVLTHDVTRETKQDALAESAPAIIWTAEDEPEEAHRRLDIMRSASRLDTGDQLHIVDGAGTGPLWAPVSNVAREAVGDLTGAGGCLRAYCERHQPRLLVVDNLAAAFACNENDRAMVRAFMSSWDAWARDTGCAVMFIAHPSRAHSDFSGSTDWRAAARWLWRFGLEKLDPKDKSDDAECAPKLANLKANYSPDGEGTYFWVVKERHGRWRAGDKHIVARGRPGANTSFRKLPE